MASGDDGDGEIPHREFHLRIDRIAQRCSQTHGFKAIKTCPWGDQSRRWVCFKECWQGTRVQVIRVMVSAENTIQPGEFLWSNWYRRHSLMLEFCLSVFDSE